MDENTFKEKDSFLIYKCKKCGNTFTVKTENRRRTRYEFCQVADGEKIDKIDDYTEVKITRRHQCEGFGINKIGIAELIGLED